LQGRTSLDPRWDSIHEDGSAFPNETHPAMTALRTGKPVYNVVMGIFNPGEADYVWININAMPQFMPGEQKPYQVYTTFEDISKRRHADEALQHANEELAQAYDATLEGWANALDLREHETAGHSRHVVDGTVQLAQDLGITGEQLVYIRRGAFLHDIGNIGIPDSILLKPSPLNTEEWNIMRKHPQYGYDLLKKIAFLNPSVDIPYRHHERWDGTGYPDGLKVEEIPLAARIFAVVDVWDALQSDRPYRKAWTKDEAIAYLREQSGKYFDPGIVEKFLASADRIQAQ